MSKDRKTSRIAVALVTLWVVFTVTLAVWWLIFGLRQLDLINQLNLENATQLNRHYQMLMWEGGILIASLIGGGLALFYYARREQKRHGRSPTPTHPASKLSGLYREAHDGFAGAGCERNLGNADLLSSERKGLSGLRPARPSGRDTYAAWPLAL